MEYTYTQGEKKTIMVPKEVMERELKIFRQDCPTNPREDDNLGKMICFHSRYDLGDKHDYDKDEAFEISLNHENIVLPLYLYDHSGVTMNTTGFTCGFDSGCVGFIYVSKEDVLKETGITEITPESIEEVKEWLIEEVKVYDHYLKGDVYSFELYENGELVDSCGGFFGDNFTENGLFDAADWSE